MNEKFWQIPEVKALVEFLTNGVGDDHDSAVYDTKCEFDRSNPEAVRYMVSCVLNKNKTRDDVLFEYPCPTDGSVIDVNIEPQVETSMYEDYVARKNREKECERIYVPNQDKYCEIVLAATCNRDVYRANMTQEELKAEDRKNAKIEMRFWISIAWSFLKRPVLISLSAIPLILLVECSRY